ncbi:MAG: DNA/RNA nuclease SfsA [bacterium JZ-2024 1]
MRWEYPLIPAQYLGRKNRFTGEVYLEKRIQYAHIPNSSHLRELLIPGCRVYLLDYRNAKKPGIRKTPFTLLLVRSRDILACIDAQMPNRLFQENWEKKAFPQWVEYSFLKREVKVAGERLDFLLSTEKGAKAFVEVKSCTLVHKGTGLFPDPATERGARHLGVLSLLAQKGFPAHLVFIIQRKDAECLKPNEKVDPKFTQALKKAVARGVRVSAYTCRVSLKGMEIFREVPVCL